MMQRNALIGIFLTLWLTSCASIPESTPQNDTPTWGSRVEVLSNIEDWDMDALISIRNNAKRDSGSANMQWRQSRARYSIFLYGPLGSGAFKLTGNANQVLLEKANGQKVTAKTPEMLLTEETGWNLPVSHLYYWIRGLPVPHFPSEKRFDNTHHLVQLNQQGWTIQYLRYSSVGQIDLPTKIFLNNATINVKISISQWQI